MTVLVRNIRMPLAASEHEVMEQAVLRLAPFVDKKDVIGRYLFRRSVDTRHKTVTLVYTVALDLAISLSEEVLEKNDCVAFEEPKSPLADLTYGSEPMTARPVVCGFGPAGMFAALLLAEAGYRPIVLERGDSVLVRTQRVGHFLRTGELDVSSNIQFGAGGAGTFSDGKLMTRISDERCRYVLQRLVECGAPRDILVNAKPHIGTDKLLGVVAAIDARIRALGGEILYRTQLSDLTVKNGRVHSVKAGGEEIPCGALLLAIGHSARDTYALLKNKGLMLAPKPFSVGVRIEHLQADIDRAVYGRYAGHAKLGPAEYSLSHREGERAVYTFCMCPGGEVIAAASEEGGVVTNGMSRHARDGANANAALAVSVMPEGDPIAFQRSLEQAAYALGGGDYKAPIQTVGDFLSGKNGREPKRILPTYRHGKVTLAPLSALFPEEITSMLRVGIRNFDKKLHGFAVSDAVLTGVESRTSSPVRILRKEDGTALGCDNLYPCGEGAGYAGGITSAAVDGLRLAEAILRRYAPYKE